jgi:hypothetical protein
VSAGEVFARRVAVELQTRAPYSCGAAVFSVVVVAEALVVSDRMNNAIPIDRPNANITTTTYIVRI